MYGASIVSMNRSKLEVFNYAKVLGVFNAFEMKRRRTWTSHWKINSQSRAAPSAPQATPKT